jgi:hypothetical protein
MQRPFEVGQVWLPGPQASTVTGMSRQRSDAPDVATSAMPLL